MKKIIWGLLILTIGFLRCSAPDLRSLDFVEVTVLPPQFVNFNQAELLGQVLDLGAITSGECGFIWAYERDAVEELRADAQRIVLPLSALEGDGRFRINLGNLDRERTIFIRTFVQVALEKVGERLVYSSAVETFSVGEIVANTGKAQIFNDSAVVFGQLRGIEILNQTVDQRGHVISPSNSLPSLGCPDCQSFSAGSSNNDDVYSSHFPHLALNTAYFSRAYAIANTDTFYSKRLDTIFVLGGWQRVADFPYGYTEGGAAAIGGFAYAGFGCQKANGCLYSDLTTDFWKFDPLANNNFGAWTPSVPLSAFTLKRYNSTVFAANDFIHAIFGEFFENNEPNVLRSFSRLNPNAGDWQQTNLDTVYSDGRSGAVSFSIGGKVFVGTGKDQNNLVLNDFKEYDPTSGNWRAIASLPKQLNPSSPVQNVGRFEAVAFSIGGYGYVGTGQSGGVVLRDFWRFRPPVNSNDLGEWEQIAFLPPVAEARYQAAAFSIENSGYIGSGYNPTEGYLKDWWQYNPDNNSWQAVALFPAPARTNGMAFNINGNGYFGTGQTKILSNGGLSNTEFTLSDFWRYIPEN